MTSAALISNENKQLMMDKHLFCISDAAWALLEDGQVQRYIADLKKYNLYQLPYHPWSIVIRVSAWSLFDVSKNLENLSTQGLTGSRLVSALKLREDYIAKLKAMTVDYFAYDPDEGVVEELLSELSPERVIIVRAECIKVTDALVYLLRTRGVSKERACRENFKQKYNSRTFLDVPPPPATYVTRINNKREYISTEQGGGGYSVCTHPRRGHVHDVWVGPKGYQELCARDYPPCVVNEDGWMTRTRKMYKL
jgi:hypothetical protein